MKSARVGLSLLATVAIALAPLSLSAPAQAADGTAEPLPTTTTLVGTAGTIVWGTKWSPRLAVSSNDNGDVDGAWGNVDLLRRLPSESSWTTLGNYYYRGSSDLPWQTATKPMWYKVVFRGGVDWLGRQTAPSESQPLKVTVTHRVRTRWVRGTKLRVAIAPAYKRRPVVLRVKRGKQYVVWKRLTTNRNSVAVFRLPPYPSNPRKIQKFKLTVPRTPTLVKCEQVLNRPYFFS